MRGQLQLSMYHPVAIGGPTISGRHLAECLEQPVGAAGVALWTLGTQPSSGWRSPHVLGRFSMMAARAEVVNRELPHLRFCHGPTNKTSSSPRIR
jgi:hypothetical protein